MMSTCRVFSCVVGRGCLLWPVHFLGKTLLIFALLHSAFQGQICLLLQVFLDFRGNAFNFSPLKIMFAVSLSYMALLFWGMFLLHMDITRWSTTKSVWLYSLQPKMEKLYTVSKNKTGNWLWLRLWTPYCQIWLKLKKVGKTTRPFIYDLNQILYDYIVEVRNRFKGLVLIDIVPDELWTEVRDIVQETGLKSIPMEKKCKKAKWLSEEALQIAVKRREAKQRRKGKIVPSECRIPKNSKIRKPSSVINAKK